MIALNGGKRLTSSLLDIPVGNRFTFDSGTCMVSNLCRWKFDF
ncbi:hypothetical protein [Endozoicomonas sp. YOMI1]